MLYMFKIFIVVAIPIFGLAGAALLTLAAWSAAKDYARARVAMRRIASPLSSENRSAESLRAA